MFTRAVELGAEMPIRAEGGDIVVTCLIGYDEAYSYLLFVALSPMAGYADIPGYELVFAVLKADDEGEVSRHWDGSDLRHVISDPEDRALIMEVLCEAVSRIIDASDANLISTTTHTADLPTKALAKFYRLVTIIGEKGFKTEQADEWHGRNAWMMWRD